ncbi:MAG: hypothetical protein QXU97_04285 [Fervidicoccaceae archaeon]
MSGRSRRIRQAIWGGALLIGVSVLLSMNAIWPWILSLLGAALILDAALAGGASREEV